MDSASLKVSVINENNIQVTSERYNYYNNRFLNGAESQHFQDQTLKKEARDTLGTGDECKKSFDAAISDNSSDEFSRSFYSRYEPNLQVGLSQSSLVQHNDIKKSIHGGHVPIWIPLKADGAASVIPYEENCLHHGHGECQKGDSKWVLTGKRNPHKIVQNDIPDYTTTRKCDTEASVDVTANKHNHWNLEIHDCLWCPCILYFVFIFCIPALLFMHQSDVAFRKGRDSTARYYAMCSSLFYVIGFVLSLGCYAMIIALVVVFAK